MLAVLVAVLTTVGPAVAGCAAMYAAGCAAYDLAKAVGKRVYAVY